MGGCTTALLCGLPHGRNDLLARPEEEQISWRHRSCFCCVSTSTCSRVVVVVVVHSIRKLSSRRVQKQLFSSSYTGQLNLRPAPTVAKAKITCCTILRDVLLSFVFAFLFHLIPSLIWGVETSLGSASNHQRMGAVWFGGWAIWCPLFIIGLRPWGLHHEGNFIQIPTKSDAERAAERWTSIIDSPDVLPTLQKQRLVQPAQIVGSFVFAFLIIWGLVTMSMVQACNDRGCCKDDSSTLDFCVKTGYPSLNATHM